VREIAMETQKGIEVQGQEPKAWPKVAIIVLNWNGWRCTIEGLGSVLKLTYPNYLSIIVDNGSCDDSVEKIKAWARKSLGEGYALVEYSRTAALEGGEASKEEALKVASPKARMVLIRNDENLGFTGGCNVAIRYSLQREYPADYVFLLNNDAKAEKDCLMHLIAVDQRVNAGIVGAVIMDEQGKQILFARAVPFPLMHQFLPPIARWYMRPPPAENNFWTSRRVNGAAMLIRKDVLSAVYAQTGRYLNTDLFIYGDEMDFCFVAQKAGFKSVIAKNAVVYHKVAVDLGGSFSPLPYYYSTRNCVLLANNLLTLRWKILFHLFYSPLKLGHALIRCFHRQPSVAKAIICGLVDGYRGVTGQWKRRDREVLKESI